MKERFKAKSPRSWWLRFHTQTAGVSLTAQQPEVNMVRVALQGLAAVLGGTQSLHTNSYDEAYQVPNEKAVRIALRTQQILAHETGVTNTVDPLGGSYFIESLTDYLEEEAYRYFDRIDRLGGVLPAVKKGFIQQEIANSAYRYQTEIENKERTVVGVNDYITEEVTAQEPLRISKASFENQIKRLQNLRRARDKRRLKAALGRLHDVAAGEKNTMPATLEAIKADATLGEITSVFREVFGTWKEPLLY